MKTLQVDRFEEELAVLIDNEDNRYSVHKDAFGFALHEGDLLEVCFSEDEKPISARFLEEETEALRLRARNLMARLKRKK